MSMLQMYDISSTYTLLHDAMRFTIYDNRYIKMCDAMRYYACMYYDTVPVHHARSAAVCYNIAQHYLDYILDASIAHDRTCTHIAIRHASYRDDGSIDCIGTTIRTIPELATHTFLASSNLHPIVSIQYKTSNDNNR